MNKKREAAHPLLFSLGKLISVRRRDAFAADMPLSNAQRNNDAQVAMSCHIY